MVMCKIAASNLRLLTFVLWSRSSSGIWLVSIATLRNYMDILRPRRVTFLPQTALVNIP